MAYNSFIKIDQPANEPAKSYLPGSPERASLKAELARQADEVVKIPLVINGEEVWTDTTVPVVMPHDHDHVIAEVCLAGEAEIRAAVKAAMDAKPAWEALPTEQRLSIFMKAAALASGPWRDRLNASTMLGQSKTVWQAEIDAGCELSDFLRFNVHNAYEIYGEQSMTVGTNEWNRIVWRPLEGFVVAISPFNFTSIGCGLSTAPAIAGNTVLWKPSTTAVLSSWYFYQVLEAAGLPAGVINFLPCRGTDLSAYALSDKDFGGFHFTGSTKVFKQVWKTVGDNIFTYRSYPRLVGETGGKDFVFAHPTADVEALVTGITRAAFEYQGQKCSACSRAYIPASLWPLVKERLLEEVAKLKVGDVADFRTMLGAVIDQKAFDRITAAIDAARASEDADVLCGGYDGSKGWFVEPTIIQAKTPDYDTMLRELFGPVLTVYVYDDDKLEETLDHCANAAEYALTGSIYAEDREAVAHMEWVLRQAAGNFYINEKPTGATVGQQPFGGARGSGTNDKAGTTGNMRRWMSPCSIKEVFVPGTEVSYPYMSEE